MPKTKPHGLTGKPSNRKGKRTAEDSRTRSLRLPVSLWDALETKAEGEGVSTNSLIRSALEKAAV